ncbi:MurR/RpiR family transcriptional regulator [Labrys wisconsinensis]|uniref:DNA-binding MurR/RpiR family transcriptional regulator n=1 Tax=Labrys wisconsinensis TaxID=425677 RepID=A0ABU0JNS6_9HYPH|nr:MurR/RpiR family transcriptional regulator [Labrys wisconsinensis]MDQ0475290.1 DNA-binding MurR/RpiR family transcriptional regulator [Labrys wisconsinensis]
MDGKLRRGRDREVAAAPGIGIDIFQKLVAASRSADRTMARLARFIIDNQDQLASLSISSLAQQLSVSETTVFRFCKILGLAGYKDLRYALAESRGLSAGARLTDFRPEPGSGTVHPLDVVMRRVVEVNSEALLKTMSLVSLPALQETVDALQKASYVILIGFGSSAPVAFDAFQRFSCLGIPAIVHSDPHTLTSATVAASPDTLFVGVSCSGLTRDVVEALDAAGRRGCKRVVITSDRDSPVTQVADIVLISAVRGSPIVHQDLGTKTSQLAIIEMICVALALQHPERQHLVHDKALFDAEIAKKRIKT